MVNVFAPWLAHVGVSFLQITEKVFNVVVGVQHQAALHSVQLRYTKEALTLLLGI